MPLNPSTEDHGTQVARVIQSTGGAGIIFKTIMALYTQQDYLVNFVKLIQAKRINRGG